MTVLPAVERLKVLVVDDDAIARRLVVATLRGRYDILEARDGVEAVEVFDAQRPDVVVMDVEMPRASGSYAARQMRLLAGTRYVPILLVSSLDELSVVVTALSQGADDFLSKPFNPRLFESKLQVFLRLRDMQQRLVEQNLQLSRFREETEAEQLLAREVFSRLLKRGALSDPRVRVVASPLAVLSGDIVAAAELPDGGFRWLLGDVAGHGLSGALGTLPAVTLFADGSARGVPLEALMTRLNVELKAVLPATLFCAAAMLELDATRTQLKVINAGLPDVLLCRPGAVEALPSTTMPLGITTADAFSPACTVRSVEPSCSVWAMSDGVVEALSAEGEMFAAHVIEHLRAETTVATAMPSLIERLARFTGGRQADDVAIVGVQVG